MVLIVKNLPADAGDIGDTGLIPGWKRSPGGRHGNPLQYACLENPMDRGALLAPWGHKECDTSEGTYPVCLWWIAWTSSLIFYPTLLWEASCPSETRLWTTAFPISSWFRFGMWFRLCQQDSVTVVKGRVVPRLCSKSPSGALAVRKSGNTGQMEFICGHLGGWGLFCL